MDGFCALVVIVVVVLLLAGSGGTCTCCCSIRCNNDCARCAYCRSPRGVAQMAYASKTKLYISMGVLVVVVAGGSCDSYSYNNSSN